ncbi:DNA polymerase III subunit [Aliikangiella maris]
MDYPWFAELAQKLITAHENQRLPHGLLIAAPKLSGKSNFARLLAKRLLCQATAKIQSACEQCKSCLLFNAATHPDFYLIDKLVDNKGVQKKSIGIEQIRELSDKLNDTPQMGGWRVAIVQSVSAMTRASFNALLKTLEEPKKQTLLILLADNAQIVPATIRSRCQLMSPVLNESLILPWLIDTTGVDKNTAEIALSACYMAPLAALAYIENDGAKQRASVFKLLDDILVNSLTPQDFIQQVNELAETEIVELIAEYLHQISKHKVSALHTKYDAIPDKSLHQIYAKVLEFNRALLFSSNLQFQIQIEAILLLWFELGRKIKGQSKV